MRNRVQHVTIGNCLRNGLRITTGVPQGSMLCPLFFCAFNNHLPEYSTCYLYVFADELKLAGSSLTDLQNDFWSLLLWSKENKLSINFQETKLSDLNKTTANWDQPGLFVLNDENSKHESFWILVAMAFPKWSGQAIWRQKFQVALNGCQCHDETLEEITSQTLCLDYIVLQVIFANLCFSCLAPKQKWLEKSKQTGKSIY